MIPFICCNNILHQFMSDNVLFGQAHDGNIVDILQHLHRSAQLQNFQQKRSVLFCKHFTKPDSLRDTTTDWIMFCNHFKRAAGTNFAPPQVFSDSFGIASLCENKCPCGIIDDENGPVTNQPVLYIKEMNRAAFSDLGLLLWPH